MEITSQFLQYYTYNIVSLLLFFTIGTLAYKLLNIQSQTSYKTTFYRIVIGLLMFTMSVAVFRTSGKSVLIFLVIPLYTFFSYLYNEGKEEKANNTHEHTNYKEIILSILFFCAFITGYFTYTYIRPDKLFSTLPNTDYNFYAKVSTYIWNQRTENAYINYIYRDGGLMPYHYFELWLNVGLSKVFGTNQLYQLMLSTYAICICIVWLGIMTIFNYIGRINWYTYIFAGLSLFVSGLYFSFYKDINFLSQTDLFANHMFSMPKLATVYLFLTIITLGLIKNNTKLFITGVFFLSVTYTTMLPLLFTSATLYVLCMYVILREPKILMNILLMVCTALLLFIFFYLFRSKNIVHAETFNKGINFAQHIKTMINIFGGTLIHLSVIFILHLVILSVYAKDLFKRFKYNISFLILCVCIGLFEWGILHKMLDSVQLFYNFNVPLIILTFCIFLYYISQNTEKNLIKNFILIALLILVSDNLKVLACKKSLPQYDSNYVHNVLDEIKGLNPSAAFLYEKDAYNTVFLKNPNVTVPAQFTSILDTRIHPISLSVFETPLDESSPTYITEKKMVEASIFYRYVEEKKIKHQFTTIEAAQKDFITEHNIQYIFTSRNVKLNENLQSLVKEHLKDSISGEQFYLLEY
ncbi:MAG: hypothetical protein IT271_13810 [Chitinophagales bacterium]|nr:hypothetical protein [Chitinophagales bacterium]